MTPSADPLAGLDLTLPPVQKIVTCTILGIVEHEDLARLTDAAVAPVTQAPSAPGDLKRIKEKHHSVARLLATGMSQTLVCSITGYTDSYLSILLNNPSMQELVAHYRAAQTNGVEVVAQRLRHVALEAVESLADDLASGELDAQAKLGLAKLGLDRSGHGPQQKVTNISEHHLFDHAELQRLNRAARRESAEDIIELTPQLPPPSEADL